MSDDATVTITATDGVAISAFEARPEGMPKGGIVVLQELFGVNPHIRSVCRGFAREGYVALAPALFDRIRPGIELGYGPDAIQTGLAARDHLPLKHALADVQAAIDHLRPFCRVGVVGYCWGGTLAFLAAARLSGLSAAVGYYGSMIPDYHSEAPRVPLMLHFGASDHTLPPERVALVEKSRPDAQLFVYEAGHGFNCEERPSFDRVSAGLARARTLELFEAAVAQ